MPFGVAGERRVGSRTGRKASRHDPPKVCKPKADAGTENNLGLDAGEVALARNSLTMYVHEMWESSG